MCGVGNSIFSDVFLHSIVDTAIVISASGHHCDNKRIGEKEW